MQGHDVELGHIIIFYSTTHKILLKKNENIFLDIIINNKIILFLELATSICCGCGQI